MNNKRKILNNFIAIEGIDGSGTTTLSELLKSSIKNSGATVELGREPTNGSLGKKIRKILAGEEKVKPETLAFLFAADRNEHLYGPEGIHTVTEKGGIYITDRYLFSSLAYQGVMSQWDWVNSINSIFPLPEYLIFLRIPVDTAMKRISQREEMEIFENEPLQSRVAKMYQTTLDKYRNTEMRILEMDSRESPETLQEKALDFLQRVHSHSD